MIHAFQTQVVVAALVVAGRGYNFIRQANRLLGNLLLGCTSITG